MRTIPGILAAMAISFTQGCGPGGSGGGGSGHSGPDIVVRITPGSTFIKMDATAAFSAEVSVDGVTVEAVTWAWSTPDPGIAEHLTSGVFRGVGGGAATIEAVSIDPPGYRGRAHLQVEAPDLVALVSGQAGSYPWEGGTWTPADFGFGGGIHGICAGTGRSVYLLHGGAGLFRVDWDDPGSATMVQPMIWDTPTILKGGETIVIGNRINLARDGAGRIYLSVDGLASPDATQVGGRILRYVPLTGELELYATDPAGGMFSSALAFDSQDNLHVLSGVVESGGALVYKISPDPGRTTTVVAECPGLPDGHAGVTGGLAVLPDGSAFYAAVSVVVMGGDMVGGVYRFTPASGAGVSCSGEWHQPGGLFWTGTDLLVSDKFSGIFKLHVGAVGGAITLFSEVPASDDKTTTVFVRLNQQ